MSLDQDIRYLSALPLLAALGPEALRLMAFSGETRLFRAGDVLFRRGEPSDGGFIIMVGAVALDATDEGRPARQIVGPGALIGERALISALPRPATAIAREPTTVLKITRRLFHRVLAEFPEGTERMRQNLAAALNERLADLTSEA